MRKWAFWLAATAAVVIGCGGSSGGGGSTTTSGTTSGRALAATVNLPSTSGVVTVGYLTGQGRDVNPIVVTMTRVYLENTDFARPNDIQRLAITPIPLALETYSTVQQAILVAQFTGNNAFLDSSLFTKFAFDPDYIQKDGPLGDKATARDTTIPYNIPSAIRVFPGRQTFVSLNLDSSMISVDSSGVATMDQAQFNAVNFGTGATLLKSRLSDYVRFDISALASRPILSDGVTPASYIYFSGDNYAMSDADPRGVFETLTDDPHNPIHGRVAPPSSSGTAKFPGTYDNRFTNPQDVSGASLVTSLVGTWNNYTTVLSNIHPFEIIMLPNSAEKYDTTHKGDLVAFVRNSNGVITNMYFGGADLDKGVFKLFPIANIVGADITGELDGTLTNYLTGGGNVASLNDLATVRTGTYTFPTGISDPVLPTGFLPTGTFVVFRR